MCALPARATAPVLVYRTVVTIGQWEASTEDFK